MWKVYSWLPGYSSDHTVNNSTFSTPAGSASGSECLECSWWKGFQSHTLDHPVTWDTWNYVGINWVTLADCKMLLVLPNRYYVYKTVSNDFSWDFVTSMLLWLIKIKHIALQILHVTSCVLVFLFLPPTTNASTLPSKGCQAVLDSHNEILWCKVFKKTPTRNYTSLCGFTWQVLLCLHRKLEWEFCDFLLLPKYCNVAILCWLLLSGWPITL